MAVNASLQILMSDTLIAWIMKEFKTQKACSEGTVLQLHKVEFKISWHFSPEKRKSNISWRRTC